MQRLPFALITFFIVLSTLSCSSSKNGHWTRLIPEKTSFVVIPAEQSGFSGFIDTEYTDLLEDLTSGSLQQMLFFEQDGAPAFRLKALAVYPATSTESQIIWIAETSGSLKKWAEQFYESLQQNYYKFDGITVQRISDAGSYIYAAQVNNMAVISYSSIALEAALRSYSGKEPAMSFATEPAAGQFIMNTPELDLWTEQFAAANYRPAMVDMFKGISAAGLSLEQHSDGISLSGSLTADEETHSVLATALTGEPQPVLLDRYIASSASAFAIMRLEPLRIPEEPKSELITPLDSLLLANQSEYSKIAGLIDRPFAFVAFAESSLLTSGEYLFLRKLNNATQLREFISDLAERGYAVPQGNSFLVNSTVLAQLIGSELSTFKDFYLTFTGDVAVISKRRGLSESVNADRLRRRVIYYDNDYTETRNALPDAVSSFFWARSTEFRKYLSPFLLPVNVSSSLFNRFDFVTITLQNQGDNTISFRLSTSAEKGFDVPYRELWVAPLNGGKLTGAPIAGDIIGSSAPEIIYATTNGELTAAAGDGTIVMQASTDGNVPVGSPVLYDWYSNNQPVILLAAGSKIYGWNQSGTLLPRFPIELNAQITAPIVVTDVLRNGVPEIIVATDDRKLHILDRRGENIQGWPQNVNANITSAPLYAEIDGNFSVWAFSQNVLHSWLRNGSTRPGYPQFINAGLNGSPIDYKNNILAAGSDGYIYSFGKYPVFSDSLSTQIKSDSISVKGVYISNNELLSLGRENNVLLKNEEGFFRSDLISTQSRNGSVFFISPAGELRLTQNLGQPASSTYHPELKDINADKNQDVIALADFGRLFAWDVLTGERIYDLPTSGMSHPLIIDLNGDGQFELIAETRDGLRCWTIYRAAK